MRAVAAPAPAPAAAAEHLNYLRSFVLALDGVQQARRLHTPAERVGQLLCAVDLTRPPQRRVEHLPVPVSREGLAFLAAAGLRGLRPDALARRAGAPAVARAPRLAQPPVGLAREHPPPLHPASLPPSAYSSFAAFSWYMSAGTL